VAGEPAWEPDVSGQGVERTLGLDPQAHPRRGREAELAGELADLVGVVGGDLVEWVHHEVPAARDDRP
jgi:hypothetical protein